MLKKINAFMDNVKDAERISYLLVRKRMNEISAEEERELNDWAAQSSEYEAMVKDWEADGYLTSDYDEFSAADISYPLADMKRMIGRQRGQRNPAVRKWLTAVSSVAAVVLLFIGVRAFTHTPVEDNIIERISGGMPVLLLEDGSEILLAGNKAMARNGMVTVENESGESRVVNFPTTTTYNTIIIPKGCLYQLTLDDGTQVWLNADSRLKYPVSFGQDKREVELSGEAYFAVTKDESRPFRVLAEGNQIEVLGTEFNVCAYAGETTSYTSLIEGSIKVSTETQELILRPGQQAVLSGNILTSREINTKNISGWRNGEMFILEDQPLEQIMSNLSRWYDFEVRYDDEAIKKIVFNGMTPRYDDFNRVLELLRKTGEIDFNIKEKTVYVKPKK